MLSGFLVELGGQCLHIALNLTPLYAIYLINISCPRVVDSFIKHPESVQSHYTFLKLFISQTIPEEHLLGIVLEISHSLILFCNLELHLAGTPSQTLLTHP